MPSTARRTRRTVGSANASAETPVAVVAAPVPAAAQPGEPGVIGGTCPVDGRPLRPVAMTAAADLPGIVARARAAQEAWAQRGFASRLAALKRAAKRMLERRQEVIDLVRLEIGKLEVEALMSEALGPLDQLSGWAGVVRRA